MKICKICRNSDVLCQACQKKVERGEISQLEVKLDRILSKMDKDMNFKKVLEVDNTVIIFTDNPSLLIGKGGKNVKKIQEELGKKVKIVENSDRIEKIASDLLGASIIGTNIKYTKEGEEYVIRLGKNKKRSNTSQIKKILNELSDKKINIKYE